MQRRHPCASLCIMSASSFCALCLVLFLCFCPFVPLCVHRVCIFCVLSCVADVCILCIFCVLSCVAVPHVCILLCASFRASPYFCILLCVTFRASPFFERWCISSLTCIFLTPVTWSTLSIASLWGVGLSVECGSVERGSVERSVKPSRWEHVAVKGGCLVPSLAGCLVTFSWSRSPWPWWCVQKALVGQ